MTDEITNRVRDLNDNLRKGIFCPSPNMVVFAGDVVHEPELHFPLLARVFHYKAFSPDNDPHGEHDMGFFIHEGVNYMWKIDYYDRDLKWHSPDKSDPSVTTRVLTIMKSSDY